MNHLLLMLISLSRIGLNITHLLKNKLRNQYQLKRIYNVDPVVPIAYIEKPPFPVRIKEHAIVSTVVNKSYIRTPKPDEQIKVEPSVSMVKDLLEENIDGHVIYFCNEAPRIVKPDEKDKHRPVVGMPIVSIKIGDHCYHGC